LYNYFKIMAGRRILKKNIVIVCLNDFLLKEVSESVAKKFKMDFVDIDEHIEKKLLENKGESLSFASEFLTKLEREYIQKLTKKNNTVFSISAETFLANNNCDYFHNFSVVYIATEIHKIDINTIKSKAERTRIIQNTEIQQNLNDFLSVSANYVVLNADIKEVDEIVKEIEELI